MHTASCTLVLTALSSFSRPALSFSRGLLAAAAVIAFTLAAHGAVTEFPGIGGIAITDNANAEPYPSTCTVTGITGAVLSVRVKLNDLTHSFPDDVDVFLVAPGGEVCVVLSDAGEGRDLANVNLVFDDTANTMIPDSTAITSGTYRPANYGTAEALPPGGLGSIGANLTALAAGTVNGVWKLFVSDDAQNDAGSIASWGLLIETPVEERDFHTATLLHDGQVLVAGGSPRSGGFLSSTALYNPATGAWRGTGSLATPRRSHSATMLPSGKVLVVGGLNGSSYVGSAEVYDPAAGTWRGAGTLVAARIQHSATLLPDGSVLIAGGANATINNLADAELYDPANGTWTATAALSTGRRVHSATMLPSGKVLVAGGANATSNHLGSAELYDPAARTWTGTGALVSSRGNHTATLLASGKVLIAGGRNVTLTLSSAELYDPAGAGTWSITGAFGTGRESHTSTLLPNGKVLIAGGLSATSGQLSSAQLYDPAGGGTWSATTPLATARQNHTATLLPNAKVLLAGGSGAGGILTGAEFSNPGAGTWSAAGILAPPRSNQTATLLPNSKVLVAGGDGPGGNFFANADLYDPFTATWSAASALAAIRSYHTATLLSNGKVLVAGGIGFGYYSSAELYDPAADTWSATGSLTTARHSHTATSLADGKVLFAGGVGGSTNAYLTSTELYDPATGASSAIGPLLNGRVSHTATLMPNGKVLVAGGYTSAGSFRSVELYDPATGTWRETANLAVGRSSHTATLLPNGRVLVAGGISSAYSSFSFVSSAELYDPIAGTWSGTGVLATRRSSHTATLLPNGKVLVAGGGGDSGIVTTTELYDPTTGTWSSGTPAPAIEDHIATLLANGKVLLTGGYTSGRALRDSAELYDTGLDFSGAWQPQISAASFDAAGQLVLTGTGFRGISSASGGNGAQNSPTNYPVVQLRPLASEQSVFLLSDSDATVSATGFTSVPVPRFSGYAVATVFANGIPSAGFFVAFPDIAVAQPMGTVIADGGTRSFVTLLGVPLTLVFNVANTGGDNLTGLTLTKDGTSAADFAITASPAAPVLPGGSTTFAVQFAATIGGVKTAAIHIASNVAGKNPYDITLLGRALSFVEDTDADGMNDASEFQLRTMGFNWQVSQATLVATYYAHASGAGLHTTSQIQALNVGARFLQRDPASTQFRLELAMEKSTDLTNFLPFPFTATGTTVRQDGKIEFLFTVPDTATFFRLGTQ